MISLNRWCCLLFFLIQLCFYCFSFLYSVMRFSRAWKNKQKNFTQRIFYISLNLIYFTRIILFGIFYYIVENQFDMLRNNPDAYFRYFMASFDFPKCFLYSCLYMLAMIYIFSHYEAHYEIYELIKLFDWFTLRSLKILLFAIMGLLPAWFGFYNVLFMSKLLPDIAYLSIQMIQCICLILGGFYLLCYKSFKFSGYPYLDQFYKDKCKYILNVAIFWLLGRIIELTQYIYICVVLTYTDLTLSSLTYGDSLLSLLFIFGQVTDLLFSEFLAGIFVLDRSFIDLFNYPVYLVYGDIDSSITTKELQNKNEVSIGQFFDNQEKNYHKLIHNDQEDINKMLDQDKTEERKSIPPKKTQQHQQSIKIYDPIPKQNDDVLFGHFLGEAEDDKKIIQSITESETHYNNKESTISPIFNNDSTLKFTTRNSYKPRSNGLLQGQIRFESLIIDKEPIYQRPNGLGRVLFGQRNSARIKIRELPINKVNKFQATEISNEICTWKNMPIDGIEKNCKFCNHKDILYIISECNSDMVDQDTYIKSGSRENLTLMNKFGIIMKLVNIMEQLNKPGIEKGHGHLSPSNILISKNGSKLKIIDFGFVFLKKYSGFLFGYCNKSQYTCPEQLQEKGQVILEAGEKCDVYSFGLIMWFLLCEQIPFEGMNLNEINKYIVNDKARPKIPESVNSHLSHLIRVCWQNDAINRPDFKKIGEFLTNMKNDF